MTDLQNMQTVKGAPARTDAQVRSVITQAIALHRIDEDQGELLFWLHGFGQDKNLSDSALAESMKVSNGAISQLFSGKYTAEDWSPMIDRIKALKEVEEYRHQVMREEAGCDSIKQLNRKADFDVCIKRFAADSGDYLHAVEIGLQETKRRAYVVKVMSVQIMQLKGGSETDARNYLEGLINQAHVPCGVCSTDNSFWMDVSTRSLQNLLQILDTCRRKLLKANFPTFPVKLDDTVRYEVSGPIRTRYTGLPSTYYAQLPFHVNVR